MACVCMSYLIDAFAGESGTVWVSSAISVPLVLQGKGFVLQLGPHIALGSLLVVL